MNLFYIFTIIFVIIPLVGFSGYFFYLGYDELQKSKRPITKVSATLTKIKYICVTTKTDSDCHVNGTLTFKDTNNNTIIRNNIFIKECKKNNCNLTEGMSNDIYYLDNNPNGEIVYKPFDDTNKTIGFVLGGSFLFIAIVIVLVMYYFSKKQTSS